MVMQNVSIIQNVLLSLLWLNPMVVYFFIVRFYGLWKATTMKTLVFQYGCEGFQERANPGKIITLNVGGTSLWAGVLDEQKVTQESANPPSALLPAL